METDPIAPIVLRARTAASAERAWAALTEPDLVAEWFAATTRIDGGIGAVYSIDFGGGSVVDGTIRELVEGRRLAYSWQWRGEPAQATRVTWTVEPDGTGARIGLDHGGWAEAGAAGSVRDDHAGYWEGYVSDLVDLLEGEDVG